MDATNFVYWLQGWIEIQNPKTISEAQLWEIKNHLALARTEESIQKTEERANVETIYPLGNIQPSGVNVNLLGRYKKDEVFVTITKHPLWADDTYTYCPNEVSLCASLCQDLGISANPAHMKIVVSNELAPKATYSPNLKVSAPNHLVGLPTGGMGLVNIGLGEPLIC
jgi:hypothetical protein